MSDEQTILTWAMFGGVGTELCDRAPTLDRSPQLPRMCPAARSNEFGAEHREVLPGLGTNHFCDLGSCILRNNGYLLMPNPAHHSGSWVLSCSVPKGLPGAQRRIYSSSHGLVGPPPRHENGAGRPCYPGPERVERRRAGGEWCREPEFEQAPEAPLGSTDCCPPAVGERARQSPVRGASRSPVPGVLA